MSDVILGLALPLLFTPVLARRERLGGAVGQLIIAGLGLAAFHQGGGTLDPGELQTIAAQSPYDARFIGITAGVLVSGACLLPDIRYWRRSLLGLPLAVTMGWISMSALGPLVAGVAIGCVPAALGRAFGGATSVGRPGVPFAVFQRIGRFGSLAIGVSVALLLTVLLRDQVLLAVILAFGLATLANRADRDHL